MFSLNPFSKAPFSSKGEASVDVEINVNGVLATAEVGNAVTPSIDVFIEGVTANVAVSPVVAKTPSQDQGALLGFGSFGEDAFSSVGPTQGGSGVNVNVDVVGVSATSAVGQVDASGVVSVNVDVTGVFATAAVGQIQATGSADAPVTGVFATGNVGSVVAQASVDAPVTGVFATGNVGSVAVIGSAVTNLTGVSASGEIGSAEVIPAVDALLTGVEATGQVGVATSLVPVNVLVNVTGIEANALVVPATNAFNLLELNTTLYQSKDLQVVFTAGGGSGSINITYATIGQFSSDGRLFSVFTNSTGLGNRFYYFSLATPWDLTNVTYLGNSGFSLVPQNASQGRFGEDGKTAYSFFFNTDGNPSTAYQRLDIDPPYFGTTSIGSLIQQDITSFLPVYVSGAQPTSVWFSENGDYLFIGDVTAIRSCTKLTLSSPWDITSISSSENISLPQLPSTTISGFAFDSDGSRFISNYFSGTDVTQLLLNENYGLSSSNALQGALSGIDGTLATPIQWSSDGSKLFWGAGRLTPLASRDIISSYRVNADGAIVVVETTQAVPVSGVLATGAVGTVATIESTNVSLLGVAGSGQIGVVSVEASGTIAVDVTGVSAFGEVSAVSVAAQGNVSVPVTGIFSLGLVGQVDVEEGASVLLTGVEAAGFVGQVDIQRVTEVPVTGVSSTGQVGDVAVAVALDVPVTGVEATGFIGDVQVLAVQSVEVPVTGVEANALLSEVVVSTSVDALVTGVSATGFVNDVVVSGDAVTGVSGVGGVGFVSAVVVEADVDVPVTGVSGEGFTGSVATTGTAQVDLIGVSATGFAGQAQVSGTSQTDLTGVSGTGFAGQVEAFASTVALVTGVSGILQTARSGLFQAYSDAKLSTARAKFGVSSLLLDGGLDYVGPTENNVWGSGDFTVEFWSYRTTNPASNQVLFDCRTATNNGLLIFVDSIGRLNLVVNGGAGGTFATGTSSGVWNAAAIVRESGILSFYINGTRLGTVANSNDYSGRKFALGAVGPVNPGTLAYNGNIDEFRTSTVARYSGTTYTLASTEFASDNATQDLLHFDGANSSTQIVNSSTADWRVVATGDANTAITGVQGSGQVGTVIAGAGTLVLVNGVQGTGAVGTVQTAANADVFVTGSSGTGEVGTVAAGVQTLVLVTGVEGSGEVGTPAVDVGTSALATGVQGSGQVGTVTTVTITDVNVTGVSASGEVGSATAGSIVFVDVTGVQAVGFIGTVSYTGTTNVQVEVSGVSAIGVVGQISPWTVIPTDQTPGWFPDPDAGGSSWTPVTDDQESPWIPIAA